MFKLIEVQMQYGFYNGKEYDSEHGSFFDRGAADSYYSRDRNPHRGGVGGSSGPRIAASLAEEVEAYNAGYDYNERFGDKKDWR
jgi:hypothetical protein